MTTHYFKNILRHLQVWGLALLGLVNIGTLLPMEKPYDISENTNHIDANGLTQVRSYLHNKANTTNAITETLQQQNDSLKEITNVITQVKPTTTLTSHCYISFENENEKAQGGINRTIQTINADKTNLTNGTPININAGRNNTFKIVLPKNANNKNATAQPAYSLNEPIYNLVKNAYCFILKGDCSAALYKKKCVELLKVIEDINTCINSKDFYGQKNILEGINYPSSDESNMPIGMQKLIAFAQNVYNQAQLLRLLHMYDKELSKDKEILNLTQKLPKDLIAQEETLSLLQKIHTQLKSVYVSLSKSREQNSSVSEKLFTNLQQSLEQWAKAFNTNNSINNAVEKIMTQCDNWLPLVKHHARIENKKHTDNNNNNNYEPDNRYANGKHSQEPIRYNPNHWLNQCQGNNKLVGQLYGEPHNIPVINNLYINSPLMIDSFVLKYGVKTEDKNNNFCYALKGKIYINTPNQKGYYYRICNNKTNQPFCIEKTFTCAANTSSLNDQHEVFHRGHSCSDKSTCTMVDQCYSQKTNCTHDNWFSDNNAQQLAQHLNPIVSHQTATEDANGMTINTYHAEKHNQFNTYIDCFGNYIFKVDDSSITIWMPPTNNRNWAMEIVLDKPIKHNLM